MKDQAISIRTTCVKSLLSACTHVQLMTDELEDETFSVIVDKLGVTTNVDGPNANRLFLIGKDKSSQTIELEELEMVAFIDFLTKVYDLLEDAGDPLHCFAGQLITLTFEVAWDAEDNVIITKTGDSDE